MFFKADWQIHAPAQPARQARSRLASLLRTLNTFTLDVRAHRPTLVAEANPRPFRECNVDRLKLHTNLSLTLPMREAKEQQTLVLDHHRVPELHVLGVEEVA